MSRLEFGSPEANRIAFEIRKREEMVSKIVLEYGSVDRFYEALRQMKKEVLAAEARVDKAYADEAQLSVIRWEISEHKNLLDQLGAMRLMKEMAGLGENVCSIDPPLKIVNTKRQPTLFSLTIVSARKH